MKLSKKNPRQALKKQENSKDQALQNELKAQKEQNEKLLKQYQNAINSTWNYLNTLSAYVPNIEQSLFDKTGMSYKIEFRMPFLNQDQVNIFTKNQENLKIEQENKNPPFLNLTLKYFHRSLHFTRICQNKESLQDTIQDLKNNNLEISYLNYISSKEIYNALDKANEYLKALKIQEQQKDKVLSR